MMDLARVDRPDEPTGRSRSSLARIHVRSTTRLR